MRRGSPEEGEVKRALAALNTLVTHGLGLLFPSNRTTFYLNDIAETGLDPSHAPTDVGGGVELWRGFFSSVRTAYGGLIMNVDTTSG